MKDHPRQSEILDYMVGMMAALPRRRLRKHFRHCQSCRRRLDAESSMDERLRLGLRSPAVPRRLLERIHADLDAQVGEEEKRRAGTRRTGWRMAASGLAAALLLVLVMAPEGVGLPWIPAFGWGESAAGGFHTKVGSLVCLGCARLHRDLAQQKKCRLEDGLHTTGFRSADGQLWHFAQNSITDRLMKDPGLRGQNVKLQARTFPAIQYLQVATAQVQ